MSATPTSKPKRALLMIDMQADFCEPETHLEKPGPLAVKGGRDLSFLINSLAPYFPIRIATQDWHPPNHVSFASNHKGKKPFVDFITIANPNNADEKVESRLWPDHCVQGTPGAAIIQEIEMSLFDDHDTIKKGTSPECEMYSAFCSPFQNPRGFGDTGLAKKLKDAEVTEVWVVGLAADYCVQSTAVDAVKEGFTTYIVEEGTKAVDPAAWEASGRKAVEAAGVKVVSTKGEELKAVGWSEADREAAVKSFWMQ